MKHISIVAMFCEDIREEKRDTLTLVGLFPDNVGVPAIPVGFPKLGLYARAHIGLDLKSDVTDLVYKIRMADGAEIPLSATPKELVLKEMDNLRGGATYLGLITYALISPLSVTTAGLIQVVAHFAGREYICGHLNVELTPEPRPNGS